MSCLLILGAKPGPILPQPGLVNAVACANASGRSARDLGLPDPEITVISTIINDGSAAGKARLERLRGLNGGVVHLYAQPRRRATGRDLLRAKTWRMSPWPMRYALYKAGLRWRELVWQPADRCDALIDQLTGASPTVRDALARKRASSGVLAVALALAARRHERLVLAGFSFELTQAGFTDPNIRLRETTKSAHAETDIAVLQALGQRHPLLTTEPRVAAATGLPLLSARHAA